MNQNEVSAYKLIKNKVIVEEQPVFKAGQTFHIIQGYSSPSKSIMNKKTTNKVAPNKPILDALKAEGFEIEINHYRQVFDAVTGKVVMVKDSEWRAKKEIVHDFLGIGQDVYRYSVPHEFGGATTMKLKRGEEEVTVRAECYVKDNFCRRHGVKVCLERAFKIINPPVIENA